MIGLTFVLAGLIAFLLGRRVGRAEAAAEAIRHFAPVIPALEALAQIAEELETSASAETLKQLEAIRGASRWN